MVWKKSISLFGSFVMTFLLSFGVVNAQFDFEDAPTRRQAVNINAGNLEGASSKSN